MPEQRQRCYLIMAFGDTARRSARAARRLLPGRRTAYVALGSARGRRSHLLLRPLGGRPTHTAVPWPLDPAALELLADTALSVRDLYAVAREFPAGTADVGLDVVVFLDSSTPSSSAAYRAVERRMAAQGILGCLAAPGIRLLVLVPGRRPQAFPGEVLAVLREQVAGEAVLADHAVFFRASNIDVFTLGSADLATLAGEAVGWLLRLESDALRSSFRPPEEGDDPQKRFWSMGFAAMELNSRGLLKDTLDAYREFLGRTWLTRRWRPDRVQAEVRRVLHQLIDSDLPVAAMAESLARWAAGFFLDGGSREGPPAAAPADLGACLREMVGELAVRSERLAADLPNYRQYRPRPCDPRGRIKRFLNRLSRNRWFRWDATWTPPPDDQAALASALVRLAGLDLIVMRAQLAVDAALAPLDISSKGYPSLLGKRTPWPPEWTRDVVPQAHHRLVQEGTVPVDRIAQETLAGRSPLSMFRRALVEQLKLTPSTGGSSWTAAIEAHLPQSEDWLRRMLRGLLEQAAPWWSEPIDPRSEEAALLCLPQSEFPAMAAIADRGVQSVPWDREAIGAFRLLQYCVPQDLVLHGAEEKPRLKNRWPKPSSIGGPGK